jgi:hypothetical protein
MQLKLTLAPRLDPSIYQRQCPPRPHHNLSSPVPYPLDRGDLHHFTLTLPPGPQSAPINMATVEHCLFCFEALAASLEKRSPMSLYQVQQSWAAYPKGLDEEDEEDQQEESADSSPPSDSESGKPSSKLSVPRNPLLERLSSSSSGSSTPASSSSSSLSPSTNNTTPASSSTSFVPIGRIPVSHPYLQTLKQLQDNPSLSHSNKRS